MKCLHICAFLFQSFVFVVSNNETPSASILLRGCLSSQPVNKIFLLDDEIVESQAQSIKLQIVPNNNPCKNNVNKQDEEYFNRVVELRIENVPLPAVVLDSLVNNFTSLQVLRLVNTGLKDLSNDFSFEKLRNLIELVITGNALVNVTSAIFRGLDKLQVLSLSNNKIKHLTEDCLSDLVNLEKLELEQNLIREFPKNIFSKNKRLKMLNLKQYNTWPRFIAGSSNITETLFRENTGLEKLILTHNFIQFMHPEIFANLTHLKTLDLSSNKLIAVNQAWFKNLESLEELNFSGGPQNELNPVVLGDLRNLKILDLGHCKITQLTNESFVRLSNLEILNLKYNDLSRVRPETRILSNNFKLRTISLNSCLIEQFSATQWFLNLPKLEFVDMSNNKISYLNYTDLNSWNHNPKNVTFNFNGNKISRFYFRSSTKLNNSKGSRITVNIDSLKHAPCDFHFMKNYVATQNETKKNIHVIENSKQKIQGYPTLRSLCKCEGEFSPCSCYYNSSIIVLSCHNIKENYTFSWWPLLESYNNYSIVMDLSMGNLKRIPEIDRQFDSRVRQVNLSNNRLDEFALQLNWTERFPELQSLDLRSNKIKRIPWEFSDIFTGSTRNLMVFFDEDSFICDCSDSRWLTNLAHNLTGSIFNFENLTCDFEGNTTNLAWIARNLARSCINENEISKPNERLPVSVILTLVAVAVVIVGALAACFFSVQQQSERLRRYNIENGLQIEVQTMPLLKYDAFISYAHKDELFVINELVPNLENPSDGSPSYKLCLHQRDWLAGEWIIDQIKQSIATSHRTIIVLSENFIESFWGQQEFRIAYQQVIESKQRKLIVVVIDEVPDLAPLDEDLRHFIANNTYLKLRDPLFWKRLREALPDSKSHSDSSEGNEEKTC